MNSSLIQTFTTSDVVGQIITLTILALSILAWFVIIDKIRYLRAVERYSEAFLAQYRKDREHIFSLHFSKDHAPLCPTFKIYAAGVKELKRHTGEQENLERASGMLSELQFEEVEEAVQRTISNETAMMERLMIILAITAVVGPLMGLLGTVWGIMNAFNAMAASGSPSLLIVAPGIAGALITTVVGLLVAIPSVAAYNIFLSKIRRMGAVMDDFAGELTAAIRRRLLVH
jgi:biopolymer transport protein ExbB/TolQ